jgi:hypothetical protein
MVIRGLILFPLVFDKGGLKMEKMEGKSFNKPDEVRTFDKGKLEIISIGGRTIGQATFQPGWRWSQSVKPLVREL